MRLDIALEHRGLLPSRARARDAILRGTVTVNGERAKKPNQKIADNDEIGLADPASAYVSRAAIKLIAGLDAGAVSVERKTCLDIGASTGGFTQVLLERGAKKIFAVDVGHDQLHQEVRNDPRVTSFEGTNARDLDTGLIDAPIDLLVCDVSFVSVSKVLAPALALCRDRSTAIILIKPQFEVGREHVGKGGIVTDLEAREASIVRAIGFFASQGFSLHHRLRAPISGGDGNQEEIAVFTKESALAN